MSGRDVAHPAPSRQATPQDVARKILVAFVFTFVAARGLVFLIMLRRIPDLYLHLGETHVHHLNYGIFLLSGVGGYLLFTRPVGRRFTVAASLYGVGLALTFDEFGMWLHLNDHYWQRASFDAIVVIAGLLGLIVAAPAIKQFRPRQWTTAVALGLAVLFFAITLVSSYRYAGRRLGPRFQKIEATSPH
jgi:hypothetical protein